MRAGPAFDTESLVSSVDSLAIEDSLGRKDLKYEK
jgi:hypothetical protein